VSIKSDEITESLAFTEAAGSVHSRLAGHLPPAGLAIELDPVASVGSWLVDAGTGERYLDLYTSFASAPLGFNPPELTADLSFMARLATIAVGKPANSDLFSAPLADFTETFLRVLGQPEYPYLFFIEGGALAVENALKCAFDWKSRRLERAGLGARHGLKVMHLRHAFHGRSGYTLSLTNTDLVKTDRFPMFEWPRIDSPAIRFPLDTHLGDVVAAERRALAQAEAAFRAAPHEIACFIAEPIQCEAGDNHLRAEFLQEMQRACHRHDSLFILDEVQTGAGVTGSPWAYQQLGLEPDIVVFAKKVQVGGIMAGRRVLEEPANVFTVPGRISSTWGGGLVDMVRSQRYLEIIERDGLIPRAGRVGTWLLGELRTLAADFPDLMDNVRGRGLLLAFDLPDRAIRDTLLERLLDEHLLVLPGGERSVRVRPALNVTEDDLRLALRALTRGLESTRCQPPGPGA
jgi:L-lysine 6-transaminase